MKTFIFLTLMGCLAEAKTPLQISMYRDQYCTKPFWSGLEERCQSARSVEALRLISLESYDQCVARGERSGDLAALARNESACKARQVARDVSAESFVAAASKCMTPEPQRAARPRIAPR